MKRSIIAVAAFLLLLSSATYANPPRPRPRPRFFMGPVLCWLRFVCHPRPVRVLRPALPPHRPHWFAPEHRGRPNPGRNRHDPPRGRKPDNDGHRGHGREHGRDGGRG